MEKSISNVCLNTDCLRPGVSNSFSSGATWRKIYYQEGRTSKIMVCNLKMATSDCFDFCFNTVRKLDKHNNTINHKTLKGFLKIITTKNTQKWPVVQHL